MRNKGFSLIELLVVLGIIGILSSFITPKVMTYMAKGKDTKVIAVLESLRTASQLYYLEEGKSFIQGEPYGEITVEQFGRLEKYLSNNAKDLIKDNKVEIEIGGSKESPEIKEIIYGGKIGFTTKDPETLDGDNKKSDGINIWFHKSNDIKDFNINGEKWIDL